MLRLSEFELTLSKVTYSMGLWLAIRFQCVWIRTINSDDISWIERKKIEWHFTHETGEHLTELDVDLQDLPPIGLFVI